MSHALYYPSIEFNDVESLKRSLLTWDRVFRIVPANYFPQDCSEVRTAQAEGRVMNLDVNDHEKSTAALGFLDFYQLRTSTGCMLTWPDGFSDETFTRLNPDKIDVKLQPLFEQLSRRLTSEGFMEVPHELAGGYMFYLANSIAQARSLDLVTDSADCWTVGTFFANNGNFAEELFVEKPDAHLLSLAINDLLPSDLSAVPMDTILRFAEENIEPRTAFQRELAALRMEISTCNNKKHAEYIVEDFVKRFERAKADYKDSIRFLSKTELYSILSVGVATTLGVLAMPGGDPYSPLRLGIGTLAGAISSLASRELINKDKTVPSYLVSAENLGRDQSYALMRKFHEFVND